ncbi:Oidioi.mRNA.OKI2018_I69.chr1.g692.t1.cds [Oikopleura dioica]|uniref:Oidioi.mRNA.OKI2018_I69.chr1.g692.t1.cds n=1 Tax=Oikopleura dioica TaxID=34765 RepID=A0ABN7SKM8_OIKDI|nr:Oidioi.mRNA.OKI2018_I69.chr1.g692.t1.cds [Oikopleura dioica]
MTILCGCFGKMRRRKPQSPSQEQLVQTFASKDSLVVELAPGDPSSRSSDALFSPISGSSAFPSSSLKPNFRPTFPSSHRQRGYCQQSLSESSSELTSSSIDWSQSSNGSNFSSDSSSSGFQFRPEQIDFNEFGKKYLSRPIGRNPIVTNVQLTKNDKMPPEMRRNIEKYEKNFALQHQSKK